MASATNPPGYGDPGAANSPWGPAPNWGYPNGGGYWSYWHWREANKPLWIAAMVLGFIFFWPVGLAILFGMMWSGRMGCWGHRRHYGYQSGGWQDGPPWAGWKGFWNGGNRDGSSASDRPSPTSGNRAFDEYRTETLRRLEEEQKDFGAFLDRLRFAKDKSEFDQFMADRRQHPPVPPHQPDVPPPG